MCLSSERVLSCGCFESMVYLSRNKTYSSFKYTTLNLKFNYMTFSLNIFSSASDNRTRRKSEPTATQSRPQSSLSSTQSIGKSSEVHAAHLPEPTRTSSTQRKPLNSPSTSSLSRSKGRCHRWYKAKA